MAKPFVHVVPFHPIVVQRPREDWHQLGVDCIGGEIVDARKGFWRMLRKVWRADVHAHGRGFPFPEMAGLFAKRAVYMPHSNSLGQRWWTRAARRFLYNRYDKIFCQTEYGKECFAKEGIRKEKLLVVPTPVDVSFFSRPAGGTAFRTKYGLGRELFALAVGLRPVKNPGVIAEACRLAGIRLVLAGPRTAAEAEQTWGAGGFGWYAPDEQMTGKKNENVIFTGQLDADEFLGALEGATIFISSSDYESFGMAVYEAAAAGKPLCLPEHGVFRHFADAALFHPPRDAAALAKNIARYLSDKKLRAYGKKAQEVARAYDYPLAKKEWERAYAEVFGERKG